MWTPVRSTLLLGAGLFLAWEAYGAARWVLDAGGIGSAATRFWTLLGSDWMILLFVTDHLVLAAVVLVLLWLDAVHRAWSLPRRLLLAMAFVALGSPVVLAYLARRPAAADGILHRPGEANG
jgi:hypothetical protein